MQVVSGQDLAGSAVVAQLGPEAARRLLQILTLHQEARWAAGMATVTRPETVGIGEVLWALERDHSGQARERLIAELQAALGGYPRSAEMRSRRNPKAPAASREQ